MQPPYSDSNHLHHYEDAYEVGRVAPDTIPATNTFYDGPLLLAPLDDSEIPDKLATNNANLASSHADETLDLEVIDEDEVQEQQFSF